MKKLISALALGVCVVALAAVAFGCGRTATPPPEGNVYNVFVIGGEGSGKYLEDTNCRIKAKVPAGKQFMYWQDGGTRLSPNEEFVFTVKEDVTIFAVFADDVTDADKEVYTVEIPKVSESGGFTDTAMAAVGAGGYFAGSDCTVTLKESDKNRTFTGWAILKADGGVGDIVSVERSYTFKVTQDVRLVPVFPYRLVQLQTPGTKMFQISDNGTMEFDRNESGTVFTDKGRTTKYVRFRVYDNENAAGEPVGEFNFEHKQERLPEDYPFGNFEHEWFRSDITKPDGTLVFIAMAEAGNIYYPDTSPAKKKEFFSRIIEGFDDDTTYYFTARLMGPSEPIEIDGATYEVLPSAESGVCAARLRINPEDKPIDAA